MARIDKIGTHKTTVSTDSANITRITYHFTTVVSFDSDTIILDTGGFTTRTTKTRMNQTSNQFNLGFRVYQEDFCFYVDYKGKTFLLDGKLVLSRSILDKQCSGYNAECQCLICDQTRLDVKRSMAS